MKRGNIQMTDAIVAKVNIKTGSASLSQNAAWRKFWVNLVAQTKNESENNQK
jgi:hypothetical protein